MPNHIPLHTEHYEDRENALAYYAGLRCFGVPKEYIELKQEDNGQTGLVLYSPDGKSPPPGFPRAGEYLDAKLDSYHQAVASLGQAMLSITGWPCQYQIRYSERAKDYVFSADVAPLREDPQYDQKMRALDKLFRQLHRETTVLATKVEHGFDAGHPLRAHSERGFAFELPMSAALGKIGHSKTLATYLPSTPDNSGGRSF